MIQIIQKVNVVIYLITICCRCKCHSLTDNIFYNCEKLPGKKNAANDEDLYSPPKQHKKQGIILV